MAHFSYKLLNASELAEIERRIEAAFHSWSSAWMTSHVDCAVTCFRASEFRLEGTAAEDSWTGVELGEGQWVALISDSCLGAHLIGESEKGGAIGNSALLADLAVRAHADFLQSLSGGNRDGELKNEAPDASFWNAGSGAIVAQLSYGSGNIVVACSPALVTSMLGNRVTTPAQKTEFAKLDKALASGRLTLKVLVGTASLEFGLLQTLAVGDVVKLDTKIDEPLNVSNEKGVHLCKALLGSREGHRCVQLIGGSG